MTLLDVLQAGGRLPAPTQRRRAWPPPVKGEAWLLRLSRDEIVHAVPPSVVPPLHLSAAAAAAVRVRFFRTYCC